MELKLDVTRKTVLKAALVMLLMMVIAFGSFTVGVDLAYKVGYDRGYKRSLEDVKGILSQKDIEFNWTGLDNGQYLFQISYKGALVYSGRTELHLLAEHYRNGILLSSSYHSMSLTDAGKDWLEGIIGNTVGSDVAKYIACSNDSSAFNASWTSVPNEITTNGLARAAGTYTSTGTGTWNITKTFSVTGTSSTKLYGLYYTSSGAGLLAAEQQGTANQKNLVAGDSLKITVQASVS
jgi:hypothetical protein